MPKEGIHCSSGYLPLYEFHFFRHLAEKLSTYRALYEGRVDYRAGLCPVCERVCADEAIWLTQNVFLGTKKDMEDIAEAVYFFASDLSAKSTGNFLNVDGGNAVTFSR